jgi:cellulase/cellobiase CelA1
VTGPGIVVGTPAYLSPEVAAGADASFASDVFSLGATLYAAVEGRPPFGFNDNTILLLQAVAAGQVPPPVKAGPLGPVLQWLLQRDPVRRPVMAHVSDALGAVADGKPVNPTLRLRSPVRRRTVVATLTAVGLVAIGLVTGILISGNKHTPVGALGGPATAHTRGIPPPDTSSNCVAAYTVTNRWPGGYQAQVTVSNPSGLTVNGWTVTLDLPDGQTITQLWNGALSRQGESVTVANLNYNATMAADGTTTFGFLGGATGTATPAVHCSAHR